MLTEDSEGQRRPFWIGVTFQNPAKPCNPTATHSWGGPGIPCISAPHPGKAEASSQADEKRRPCSYPAFPC